MTIYYHSVFCDNLLLVCILILSIYFIICCWYLLRNVLLEWQNMLNVRRHDNWQLMGPIHYLLIIFTFHIKIIFNTCYLSCKFNSNPWQVLLEKKLNVIKIASDMWWVGCFLLEWDKDCQWHVMGRLLSPGTPELWPHKIDIRNRTEIQLSYSCKTKSPKAIPLIRINFRYTDNKILLNLPLKIDHLSYKEQGNKGHPSYKEQGNKGQPSYQNRFQIHRS